MKLSEYDGKLIRATDAPGNSFTGVAEVFSDGHGEECLRIGDMALSASEIQSIKPLPTFEEAVAAIPRGRYRHFKGNEYEVLCIARHSETTEPMVVYRALYGDGGVWVRPADMWNEEVIRDGVVYQRFKKIEE